MGEAEKIARGLTWAQREALRRTKGDCLLQSQSDRGALIGPLTDYSFRPARLSPVGLAVRHYLTEMKDG